MDALVDEELLPDELLPGAELALAPDDLGALDVLAGALFEAAGVVFWPALAWVDVWDFVWPVVPFVAAGLDGLEGAEGAELDGAEREGPEEGAALDGAGALDGEGAAEGALWADGGVNGPLADSAGAVAWAEGSV